MSYAAIQSSASSAIASKGQTVAITGTIAGVYDRATATVIGTPYNVTAKAVILPLSPYRQAKDDNVQAGDEQMLLSALSSAGAPLTKPPLNSIVTVASGAKYTLVAIDPLHPDGTELLFDCIVRGNA